jgi:hypothetical protein
LNITNELREKLLTADSAEKVAELLKADGQEVEPNDVEKLWAEVTKYRQKDDRKLSVDELDAVSGGSGCSHVTLEDLENASCFEALKSRLGEEKRKGTSRQDALMIIVEYAMIDLDIMPFSQAVMAFIDKYWDLV